MASKLFTGFVVAFWAVMMTALVRVEYFPAPSRLRTVPVEQVMRRIFANADPQHLNVWHEGKDIGFCEFAISPRAGLNTPDSVPIDGRPAAYFVQAKLRLRLQVLGVPSVFRLKVDSWFDDRFELRSEYNLHTEVGGSRVAIHGDNETKKLGMKYDLGDGEQSKQFDYAQLNDPSVLQSLGLPTLPGLALPAGGSKTLHQLMPVTRAYDDRIEISGARQHAFLIECKSGKNFGLWAKIWVDDEGNVLVVETSWGVTLRAGVVDSLTKRQPVSKPISAPRPLR